MAFWSLARRMIESGSDLSASGVNAFATATAPSVTKKEKNIQTARAASAEVATLLKRIEKRMATPSQNEI